MASVSFPHLISLLAKTDKHNSTHVTNRWEVIMSQVTYQSTHDEITTVDKVVIAAALGLSVSSFYALITMTSPGAWRYFVAGGICAATSHSIPVPIDVVKVRK